MGFFDFCRKKPAQKSVGPRELGLILQGYENGGEHVSPSRLIPAHGQAWPEVRNYAGAVTICFLVGWPAGHMPDGLRQWLLLRVAAMYAQRESLNLDGVTGELPRDFVSWLLDPYTRLRWA